MDSLYWLILGCIWKYLYVGVSSNFKGYVSAKCPEGFASPCKTLRIAFAPAWPGKYPCNNALTFLAKGNSTTEPEERTTTTFLFN